MGRTLSLLGLVMFAVGIVTLSSLARGTNGASSPDAMDNKANGPIRRHRRIPAFSFDTPFSLN
jgi:hypothetical protein